MKSNAEAKLKRLSRLEGQIRGIAKMVEDDRYCIDILNQTAAAKAALKAIEKLLLEDHASHCIEDAIRSGDHAQTRHKFNELVEMMQRSNR